MKPSASGTGPPLWLLAFPVVVLLFHLGAARAKLPVEVRSESIIHHMAVSGDWLIPRVEGRPYITKPPLYHWTGAALSHLTGGSWWTAVRLPSALAAIFMLGVTLAWGTMIGGRALGVAGALATASMSLFFIMGRRGAPDMMFSALCVWALYLFERAWRTRERRLIPWFFLACGLAFMAKAHAVLLVVGAPVVAAIALRRAWRLVPWRSVALWGALAAVLSAAWYVAVFVHDPREAMYWLQLEGGHAMGVELVGHTGRHYRPAWYYLERIWDIALPASAFLPFAVWHGWRERLWREEGWGFVLGAFALVFALFTLLPAKQPHYILPLLPLAGLAIGRSVLAGLASQERDVQVRFFASLVALGVVLAALWGAIAFYALAVRGLEAPYALAGAAGAGAGMLAFVALLRRRMRAALAAALAVVWLAALVYFGSFEVWRSLGLHKQWLKKWGIETSLAPASARRKAL